MDIDTLWNLNDVRERTPQWHAYYIPSLNESAIPPKGKAGKKPLAIKSGNPYDSDGSMPSLQTVSDSSEADDDSDSGSDLFSDVGSDYDGDSSEWATDEEEDLKDLIREAMDIAMGIPDFTDAKAPVPDFDTLAEERKGNPFLKLLGSLRGESLWSSEGLCHDTCTMRSHVLVESCFEDYYSESASKTFCRWQRPNSQSDWENNSEV